MPIAATHLLTLPGPIEIPSLVRHWPSTAPLWVLYSARTHPRWARYSLLAQPAAVLTVGSSHWSLTRAPDHGDDALLDEVERRLRPFADDAIGALCAALDLARQQHVSSSLPFAGGWIASLSYDLGRMFEPAAAAPHRTPDSFDWPLAHLAWCPKAAILDHQSARTFIIGPEGDDLADLIATASNAADLHAPDDAGDDFLLEDWRPELPRAQVEAAVARTIQYIREGDIFQANIAQRFRAAFTGSPRALFAEAMRTALPWYGSLLELPDDRRLISLSPELLASFDPVTGRLTTRPIKGTLPGHRAAADLMQSTKDAAELTMIVDLMRNDIGRVCRAGSIRVDDARTIETHPTVHHGVATVSGLLRTDVSVRDLLTALFPAGSVTGAPKIRAMQIIDELEPVHRGPYCGSIGFFSSTGAFALNVAIRTLALKGADACYWAGAGIVADSDPSAEYHEMLAKTLAARALTRLRAPTAH